MAPSLCTVCQSFVRKLSRNEWNNSQDAQEWLRRTSPNCDLCRFFILKSPDLNYYIHLGSVHSFNAWMRPGMKRLRIAFHGERAGETMEAFQVLEPILLLSLEADIVTASPSAISSVPSITDTGSSAAMQLVNTWHDTCLTNRSQCKRMYSGRMINTAESTPLPRRILQISHDASAHVKIRLVETGGVENAYAALSYCCPGRATRPASKNNNGNPRRSPRWRP